MSPRRQWVLAAVVGALLLAARSEARAGDAVDISGVWILNAELSDDPHEIMQKKMEEMRERHGGYGGPGGFRGGGPPGGGHPGGPPGGFGTGGDPDRMRERLRQMEPPQRIVILQDDEKVTLMPQGRDTLTIVTDGKKHKYKTAIGEMEIQGKWKDLALELKTKGDQGREVKRRYQIGHDGRLEIVTELELPHGGDTVDIVMRYDEAKGR